MQITTAVTGSEVRFAAPAVMPEKRSPSRASIAATGTVSGFVAGILLAFLLTYLGVGTRRRTASAQRSVLNRIWTWMTAEGKGVAWLLAPEPSEGPDHAA